MTAPDTILYGVRAESSAAGRKKSHKVQPFLRQPSSAPCQQEEEDPPRPEPGHPEPPVCRPLMDERGGMQPGEHSEQGVSVGARGRQF
jgi:hypothetical protein